MADIKLPNITGKMILFVKPVWYSSHSRRNHLVAVFALSQRNISLSDLVVPSLATSLKWVMIINPTGHVQWNPIDLHIPDITGSHSDTQTNSRKQAAHSTSTVKIFHFKFLFTVQDVFWGFFCYAAWTLKTHFERWVIRMQTKEECVISQGHCVAIRCCGRRLCARMEATSLICILFRWLALVGSCRYGTFFLLLFFYPQN